VIPEATVDKAQAYSTHTAVKLHRSYMLLLDVRVTLEWLGGTCGHIVLGILGFRLLGNVENYAGLTCDAHGTLGKLMGPMAR
jgi:hypothetical protein